MGLPSRGCSRAPLDTVLHARLVRGRRVGRAQPHAGRQGSAGAPARRRAGGGAGGGTRGRAARFVRGAEGPGADVRVLDRGAGRVALDVGRFAGGRGAAAAGDTGRGGVGGGGVAGVEPEHLGGVVVPERHDEDHAAIERLPDLLKAAARGEAVGVIKRFLLRRAEPIGDRIVQNAAHIRGRRMDDLAILRE